MSSVLTGLLDRIENFERPSTNRVLGFVIVTYFMITAGIAYDLINEPPATGSELDPATGQHRPLAFVRGRINGQFIIEGLVGGFLYTLGGVGIIVLDKVHNKQIAPKYRELLFGCGLAATVVAFLGATGLIHIKMPNYLQYSS